MQAGNPCTILIEKTLRAFADPRRRSVDPDALQQLASMWQLHFRPRDPILSALLSNGWTSFWLAYEVLFSVPFSLTAFGLGVL